MTAIRSSASPPPFHRITEAGETRADRQQFELARQRYATAAALGRDAVLVEVGCGTGYGLGRLVEHVSLAIGIDIDSKNLEAARTAAPGALLLQGDATRLPLADASVDTLVGLEMFYYLPDQAAFLREARRVLRPRGSLLLTMPNPERRAFQPSPFSTRYAGYGELTEMLTAEEFAVSVYGAGPLGETSPFFETMRRALVAARLVPRTIEGRARLKRLVMRDVRSLNSILVDPDQGFADLVELGAAREADGYAILVAVAGVDR